MKRALMFAVLSLGLAVSASAQVYINEYCNDPLPPSPGIGLDTNSDGVVATSASQSNDEFVEIVNAGLMAVNISGWTLSDGVALRHTFASPTILPPGAAVVVFGGGSVATFNTLGGGTGVVASTGSLGLNNGAGPDSVVLRDALSVVIDTYTYTTVGTDSGDGYSVTRDPEAAGSPFNSHLAVSGIAHSAGFHNDGTTPYLPVISVVPQYPGNGADFAMEVTINGGNDNTLDNIHSVTAGNAVGMRFLSPGGALTNQLFAAVYYLYTTGTTLSVTTLPGDAPGTGFWPSIGGSFAFLDGFTNNFLGPSLISGGFTYGTVVPPIMAGTSVAIQGACFAPMFNPVQIGLTNCHEFRVL